MGRRPEGEQALTGAGRQARYRQRPGQAQKQGPVEAMPRRLPRGPTLSRRWNDTSPGCSPYGTSMRAGWKHCRRPRVIPPRAKPFRPWSIWTLRKSWP